MKEKPYSFFSFDLSIQRACYLRNTFCLSRIQHQIMRQDIHKQRIESHWGSRKHGSYRAHKVFYIGARWIRNKQTFSNRSRSRSQFLHEFWSSNIKRGNLGNFQKTRNGANYFMFSNTSCRGRLFRLPTSKPRTKRGRLLGPDSSWFAPETKIFR